MFYFDGTCPHCMSDRGFTCFGCSEYVIKDYDYSTTPVSDRRILEEKRKGNLLTQFSLAGLCQNCHQPVVAVCTASQRQLEAIRPCIGQTDRTTQTRVQIQAIFPQPTPLYSHPSLPEDLSKAFKDVQDMAREGITPAFIIGGCRAVLENALSKLGGAGDSLYAQIQDLRQKGLITATLEDWASIIRKTGNRALHEMKGTPEEAVELVNFTKVFLQFTFELPAEIARLKGQQG